MVNVDVGYDYNLHKRYYIVKGDVGYTKTTDIVLNQQSTIIDSTIDYCTVTFTVDVKGDRGSSDIVFYDNGLPIKVFYGGSEVEKLSWNSDITNPATISMRLSYDAEHNITARYLGNNSCLASKSRNYNIYRDRPSHYLSEITFSSVTSFTTGSTVSITGTLVADSHYSSQDIKIYVDEELASTVQTGNDGSFTYTNSELEDGVHSIRAVFEGNNYVSSTDNSIAISVGYNIDIEYDSIWVDAVGNIKVTVTDYLGNLVDDVSVSCRLNSIDVLTGVTEDGVATLTNSNQQIELSTPLTVFCEGNESNEFSPRVVYVDSLDVTADETITSSNRTVVLSVSAQGWDLGDNMVSLEGAKVYLTNASQEYVILDSNNSATSYYQGNGSGDVEITASLGVLAESIEIEDVLQYWNTNGVSYNKSYILIYGRVMELTNGYKFQSYNGKLGSVGLPYSSNDTELEFKVVNTSANPILSVGELFANTFNSKISVINSNLKANDIVKIKNKISEGLLEVYVNGNLMANHVIPQSSNKLYNLAFALGNMNNTDYVTINNVKWKVI